MKIVITGGSGFIGTNLIEYLLKLDYTILNYDISEPRNSNHNKYWIQLNVLDKEKLINQLSFDQPNYLIHLAARTDLNETKLLSNYDVNITGVENIMDGIKNLDNFKRIIIASSMLVCKVGYVPVNLNDYNPNSLYGESKVLTEQIVKKYHTNWVLIRPTSIWGPWFGAPYYNFFKLVLRGFYFNIPQNKASTKTYGFVENSCAQIYSLMIAPKEQVLHDCFYIGDPIAINITEWSNLIRKITNKKQLITLPLFVLKYGSIIGDLIVNFFNYKNFPLNSFRYKNMTTNNIIESISRTNKYLIKNHNYVDLHEATSKTIQWMKSENHIN